MDNFLAKIKDKFRTFKQFFNINPHKHWNFLIYMFLSLILVLILFSLYFLYEIKNGQIFQVTQGQQENHILLKDALLKSTINSFDSKAEKVLDTKTNFNPYSDPSL